MAKRESRGPAAQAGAVAGDGAPETTPRLAGEVVERQRQEFGGINWGSAFFGWLAAMGIAVLLTALLSAAGAALGLSTTSTSEAAGQAATIGIVGGIVLLLILMLAYFAGGYVAGRMSRFDGARQGAGAWIVGLVITILLGIVAAIFGS